MDSAPSNHDRRGRRQGLHFSPPRFLAAPLLTILEYSGLLRGRHHYFGLEEPAPHLPGALESRVGDHSQSDDNRAEVSIRIIGGSSENEQVRSLVRDAGERSSNDSQASSLHNSIRPLNGNDGSIPAPLGTVNSEEDGDTYSQIGSGLNNNRDAVSQRYEFQQLARWIEQVLPFTVLLLMVFIRQHLEGFLVTFWISIVMVKTNDLLRKQTALKGDRKTVFLLAIGAILLIHVLAVYWWYWNDDLLRPLVMVPPKHVPKFWQAIFIIIVNDTVVRLAAMVVKSGILILYKHSHGRTYRRQAELMTFVEYVLLLYRALLPTPVWYRFFLNKEYGNLFSSLSTGLYLTFKLTATLEKVHRFIAAIRTLSRREVQYGSYATSEEVLAAGDLCAICQEKMHAPILLCCKHIFCEDCVSEWFERERTCPLCRAVVKSSGLRSFGDGSTSLFFQIF